jgi:beta-phosphoglucomutase
MSLQAIVFDFDGVIADTEPVHLQAFQAELATLGLSLSREDYLAKYLGVTDREAFAIVAHDQGRELSDDVVEQLVRQKTVRMQALLAATPLVFPGVEDRVRDLAAQVPVAIASGALRAEIVAVLSAVGLAPCFPVIVSADDPVAGKPSPAPYQLAMQRLAAHAGMGEGFVPSRCVAIEDSHWGITAARAAGMRVVGITSSYTADALSGADYVVGSVAELTVDALRALTSD